jgi:hypothetical protein
VQALCASCGDDFEAKRSTAKYCSATCRKRAARSRPDPSTDTTSSSGDEHDLIATTRRELEAAGRVETFAGQLALQLAKRLATPDESGVSALSKELRTVMSAALDGVTPPAAEGGEEHAPETVVEDEVDAARRRRAEARQAAGLA